MNPLNLITDGYERKARLYPALLLVAPVVMTAVAIFPAKFSGLQSLVAAVVGCGGAFLLSQLARDAGKNGEKSLFARWGGLPSIAIFRHRDTRLDSITKVRYHKKLADLVEGTKAPTLEQEQTDPNAADGVYAAWSNYLRVNTRDTRKFALLFQENVNYGYRRNVWGLRAIGIAACALSSLVAGACLYYVHQSTEKLDEAVAAAGVFALVLLACWIFRFSADWVRVAADAYAERLAECAETLPAKTLVTEDLIR
jgi:hypothetical protein